MCLADSSISKKKLLSISSNQWNNTWGKYIGKERADEHGLNQVGTT